MNSETERLKNSVNSLEAELKDKENRIVILEADLRGMQRKMASKDAEISRQERELHKLKSVLQQASALMASKNTKNDGKDLLLLTIQEQVKSNIKKQGVSGVSVDPDKAMTAKLVDKDFRSKQLIREAIMENDFLKHMAPFQVRAIVDYMQKKTVAKGAFVIREGESGSHLYVSCEGEFEVLKDGKHLSKLGIGKAFGELAILYNCKRTASIQALIDSEVWMIDRDVFQQIMVKTGVERLHDQVQFLKGVPLLKTVPDDVLRRLSNSFETVTFSKGDYIVRQGTQGDVFFVISEGHVTVTRSIEGNNNKEEEIRTLKRGDYFGEQALLKTDLRTANIIAQSEYTECLALDRTSFFQLVGDLEELKTKRYDDKPDISSKMQALRGLGEIKMSKEVQNLTLNSLEVIATLGCGGFGRVELVNILGNKDRVFALKCLKKKHIVATHQQEHVFSEKRIMMSCNHPFITKMYRTFKDTKFVYLLMEACLGGELWTILRDRGWFDDLTTRFYVACVISALEYLHSKGVIYRDLKPENLLLDSDGYVKMVDFGFSKVIPYGNKTWTFCGTPEYVAPEIILNRGHDRSVDFWSLGVLMCELLMGTPPFTASDPVKIYNIILRGIDQIHFPRHVTKNAINIIKKFCRENPTERLGYQKDGIQDIKKHRWFTGFHWEGLESRTLAPPFRPKIQSMTDTSNFDTYPREVDIPPNETSGWDEHF